MAVQTSAFSVHEYDDPSKVLITTSERFERLMRFLENRTLVLDYETSGLAWYQHAEAVGIGLGAWDDQGRLWTSYTPFRHRTGEHQLDINLIGPALARLLGDPRTLKIAHNIKFEDHFTRREGWRLAGSRYDTMVAAHCYDENRVKKLEYRASTDLGYGPSAYDPSKMITKIVGRLAKQNKMKVSDYKDKFGYCEVPTDLAGYYGCHDIQYCGELFKFYESWGVSRHYPHVWDTEMQLTEVLCDAEQNGMPINVPYLEGVRTQARGKKNAIEGNIHHALGGRTFNWSSDDQLRSFMLKKLGCRWETLTKAGMKSKIENGWFDPLKHLSVNSDVLEMFAQQFNVLQMVLDWRDADKIDSTYTTSILEKLDCYNFLHGNLQSTGTNTGRLSCSDPNYQNFPNGPLVKAAFQVRGHGWVRLFLDYSQIELRVLAWYSRDPLMVNTFLQGGDIHDTTCREIQVIAQREIPRRLGKIVNFGLAYGLTDRGLSKQAKIPLDEATFFLNSFFQRFSGVAAFKKELAALARRQDCQWNNIYGRTRRLQDLQAGQQWQRARAERQLIASAIQGTAAQLTKVSLVRLRDLIKHMGWEEQVKICNTVHDEIQLDVRLECLPQVLQLSTVEMERFPEYQPIPIIVDAEISATNWAAKLDSKQWPNATDKDDIARLSEVNHLLQTLGGM